MVLNRAGPATCASLGARILEKGGIALLVGLKHDAFLELQALARLFVPSLSSATHPVSQPVWESPVITFPQFRHWEERDAWAARMAALYALSLKKPRLIAVECQSLLLRYVPVDFFDDKTLELAPGNEYAPELILEQAIEWGYIRASMVSRPGEIARRGDILDLFPAGYARPVRLEFFGDNIEEMRLFDGDTQRSLENIQELSLIPASPLPKDSAGVQKALKRLDCLHKEGKLDENSTYSLKKRLESLEDGILPGVAWDKASFFENWLPDEAVWFLPGEADSVEALANLRISLKESLESGEELAQPASLALRRNSQPAPWNGRSRIFAEPLRIGVEEHGLNLPERDLRSFSDLFPLPEEKDRPWQTLSRGLKAMQAKLDQVILSFSSERGRKKFLELAAQDGIAPLLRYNQNQPGIYALISPFRRGAELEWEKRIILGEDILYPRAERRERKPSSAFKGLDNFNGLTPGDLLVHRDYGIGRFGGLHHLNINNAANDFLLLEYSGQDKLYVPVDRLGLIQRFKGPEGVAPTLDKLGGAAWSMGKDKARKAIEKIAADLVEMYAWRKVAKSFHYHPPDELYREFEASFGFEETPDQARAIQDVLEDMEKDVPMDRLVCGDVGFGKTEVALRAAFRAAEEGRQVVLLCPTTVLAEQHYQTFRSRLAGFPINVGLLSRFVPKTKQKEVLKACAEGQIDILIGTHRLLSKDVKLPNLGLLILDEEQRFGVRHKDKLKALKKNVDVLTLTATPIPRTLQLSMSGIRDLSIIETAPVDRKPVASAVLERDDATLRQVIERELERKGQVFWVYNRVHGLERVVEYVKKLAPQARIGMAHGQMPEGELEETMRKFWHGEIDVLVSTSIIESGLDFPHANTLVVDQAQMFGLGQLYQLRGRVGRSDRQAYAFFVVPDSRHLSESAEERLRIILNMDYLGAGFQVAMEDLRLRGAGNILGEAQSGHISRVGLDLYLEMLEEAVSRLKGEAHEELVETEINLGIAAHIPEAYIEDGKERLRYYKALTSAQTPQAREETSLDMRDRFGPLPEELRNFLAVLDLKQFLGKVQTRKADIYGDSLRLNWDDSQTSIDPKAVASLISKRKDIKLLPPSSLSIQLDKTLGLEENLKNARLILESVRAGVQERSA